MSTSPFSTETPSGLNLCRSETCCHGHCEFICALVLLCLGTLLPWNHPPPLPSFASTWIWSLRRGVSCHQPLHWNNSIKYRVSLFRHRNYLMIFFRFPVCFQTKFARYQDVFSIVKNFGSIRIFFKGDIFFILVFLIISALLLCPSK